jgi:hypothetical protein
VLELVDRHDSGSCVRKGVEVQVLSRAFLGKVVKEGFWSVLVSVRYIEPDPEAWNMARPQAGGKVPGYDGVNVFKVVCRKDMKSRRIALYFMLCLTVCALCAGGCKRRPQDYAGLPDPNKGELVDPHKSY